MGDELRAQAARQHTQVFVSLQQNVKHFGSRSSDMEGGVCLLCDQPPRVSTSFLGRLVQAVAIPRRSLLELQEFSKVGVKLQTTLSVLSGTILTPLTFDNRRPRSEASRGGGASTAARGDSRRLCLDSTSSPLAC